MSVVVWVQDWNMLNWVTFIYLDAFVFFFCSVFDVLSVNIVKSFWYCYSWKKKQIQIRKGVQFIFHIRLTFREKGKKERGCKRKRENEKMEWQDRTPYEAQIFMENYEVVWSSINKVQFILEVDSIRERKKERARKEEKVKEKEKKSGREKKSRIWTRKRNRKRWQERMIERTMLREKDEVKDWGRKGEW